MNITKEQLVRIIENNSQTKAIDMILELVREEKIISWNEAIEAAIDNVEPGPCSCGDGYIIENSILKLKK